MSMPRRCGQALLLAAVVSTALLASASLQASERMAHREGKPSETLEQAVAHYREYNGKLDAILARSELSAADLDTIHQLTYTLENALEKMRADLAAQAEILEELHVASEKVDVEGARRHGEAYLSTARKLMP